MILEDKIYGRFEVKEPVLLELLKSPPVLRLKKISQYGIPNPYYHHKNYTRYEHSVGVMLLLRKLGAPLEEQIAGLLHDISVLAFSHVADWVFSSGGGGIEDFHNQIHKQFVRNSGLPKTLEKYGFPPERTLDDKNFPLLEREIPDLCADRVDYALREFKYWLNPKIVFKCVNGLVNYNGEIVFADKKTAFVFAINFLELQTQHWGGYEAMIRYHLFSEALKIALEKKILNRNDFFKNEPWILAKIENCQEKGIKATLASLRKRNLRQIEHNSGKKIIKKFRYVDPKIISDGKLIRLSETSVKFQKIIEKHRNINQRGLII